MIFKDYYKILSLETNRVSSEQIKNAYRLAAKKYHPDVNVQDRLSEEKIKDVNEAYRVLSNPSTKRKYDRMWTSNVGKKKYEESSRSTGSVFSDFFNMFFGASQNEKTISPKAKKMPINGENIETSIDVGLEESFYGKEKKISLRTVDGKMKVFTISIPAGIRNGEKIRLLRQGKEGINGGKNGDLFIKVNITNNKKFRLKGNDLYTDLFLTPWEAALGTKAQVSSIDEPTQVYIPEGIQTGEVIRIPGKGYKDGKGGRGDLVAEIKVMVPKKLSSEERDLFENLNKVSKFNPRSY
ncbi:MAG: DnaJ domain-containing protein [Clostridia bacterium]|nr:DnaJ domain-containing protein [Clostridia bacterium]